MKMAFKKVLFIGLLLPIANSQAEDIFSKVAIGFAKAAGIGAATLFTTGAIATGGIIVAKQFPKTSKPLAIGGTVVLGSTLAYLLKHGGVGLTAAIAGIFLLGAGIPAVPYLLLKSSKIKVKINDPRYAQALLAMNPELKDKVDFVTTDEQSIEPDQN